MPKIFKCQQTWQTQPEKSLTSQTCHVLISTLFYHFPSIPNIPSSQPLCYMHNILNILFRSRSNLLPSVLIFQGGFMNGLLGFYCLWFAFHLSCLSARWFEGFIECLARRSSFRWCWCWAGACRDDNKSMLTVDVFVLWVFCHSALFMIDGVSSCFCFLDFAVGPGLMHEVYAIACFSCLTLWFM